MARKKKYKKKRGSMSKAQSERWHFKPNILKRYGLFCNRTMYFKLRDQIRGFFSRNEDAIRQLCSGEFSYLQNEFCKLLLKQSNTRYVFRLNIPFDIFDERSIPRVPIEEGKVKVYAVYDSLRGEFCTALPWYSTDDELLDTLQNEHLYVGG